MKKWISKKHCSVSTCYQPLALRRCVSHVNNWNCLWTIGTGVKSDNKHQPQIFIMLTDQTELLHTQQKKTKTKLQTTILSKLELSVCQLHSRGSNLQSECWEQPLWAVTCCDWQSTCRVEDQVCRQPPLLPHMCERLIATDRPNF